MVSYFAFFHFVPLCNTHANTPTHTHRDQSGSMHSGLGVGICESLR